MYCPNCGANNLTEQRFCRACGLNLEKTAESLLEQLPTAESANLLKQSKLLERFGNIAFGGLVGVGAIGVIFLLVTLFRKYILSGENLTFGIFLFAFIVFASLTLAYVFLNEVMKEKKQNANSMMQKQIETSHNSKILEEKHFEPFPSITENSTELLFSKNKTNQLK